MLLITDCVSKVLRGRMCMHSPFKRMGKSLFHLSDLLISRKKIWAKSTLDSQVKWDLRAWALWQGVGCICSGRQAESSGLYIWPIQFWVSLPLFCLTERSLFCSSHVKSLTFFWPLPMLKLLKRRRKTRSRSKSFENNQVECIRFNQKASFYLLHWAWDQTPSEIMN